MASKTKLIVLLLSGLLIATLITTCKFQPIGAVMSTISQNNVESEPSIDTKRTNATSPQDIMKSGRSVSNLLDIKQSEILTTEIRDLFLSSEEVSFAFRDSKIVHFRAITISDRNVLKLFADLFTFSSGITSAPGVPSSPVFMYFKFSDTNRVIIFEPSIACSEIRVFDKISFKSYLHFPRKYQTLIN